MAIRPVLAIVGARTGRCGRTILILVLGAVALVGAAARGRGTAARSDSDGLRVRIEIAGGTHYVGQGFELGVGVTGTGQRPEVTAPAVAGADVWLIRNELKPISVSGIGGVIGESNAFISRFRVVPRRAGVLEIPPVRARLQGQTGRSRPARVTVRPVPSEGRPAEFLGGIGRFTLTADASPRSVRVGQALDYRITMTGPATWGMTGAPELKRFDRLKVALRIDSRPIEGHNEPPSRTFVYRLRPTRAGEDVLPPVAVAAFDPAAQRYITHVTPGIPIRVVGVPAFDSTTIPNLGSVDAEARRSVLIARGLVLSLAVLLMGSAAAIAWVRRRARRAGRIGGPGAARRLAARIARRLADEASGDPRELALRVRGGMIDYLRLGLGRPPGALTPDEAREGVARHTGHEELGAEAARITALCDGLLYRDAADPPREVVGRLRRDARAFFTRCAGAPEPSSCRS